VFPYLRWLLDLREPFLDVFVICEFVGEVFVVVEGCVCGCFEGVCGQRPEIADGFCGFGFVVLFEVGDFDVNF